MDQADICLRVFVRQIDKLYGDRAYTYNMHQLLHLVLSVRRWGPLWATSAFLFENYNGFLSKSVHGTKHQGKELMRNLIIAQGVLALKHDCAKTKNTLVNSEFKLLGAPCIERQFINK